MSDVKLAENMAAARREHLVPGKEIHLRGLRGSSFCEVGLITSADPGRAVANIWNTAGVFDPTPEQADALDVNAIATENGAACAWLSPVRHWMSDRLDVREAGRDKVFGEITGTWTGFTSAAALMEAGDEDSYVPGYMYRHGSVTFGRGRQVYVLDAPDGEVFVMQSAARPDDTAADERELAHLSRYLDLPAGWGFRAETLDEDMEVSSNPENLAHILHDDLRNVYLGSDAGRAFTMLAPMDSLR
jgi:hypothetical protein